VRICGLNWRCRGISLHRNSSTSTGFSCWRDIPGWWMSSSLLLRRAPSISVSWRGTASAWRGRSSSRNGVVQRRARGICCLREEDRPTRSPERSPPRAEHELSTATTSSSLHCCAMLTARQQQPSSARDSASLTVLSSRQPHRSHHTSDRSQFYRAISGCTVDFCVPGVQLKGGELLTIQIEHVSLCCLDAPQGLIDVF